MSTGKAGVVVAPDAANGMERLAHTVLDDLLYNVVHDLLIKVHRDEKMARANTAAIRVEKLASDACESSSPDSKPDVRFETDAAIYEDGRVTLKGNPLKTTQDILCPRRHLPRLLHPTDGKGARKPEPGVQYCKKHPYIDKPGFDIYGQTWVAPGPGRGKKKKDMDKKFDPNSDSPSPIPADISAKDRPPNVLNFPSATCTKCKRCILVSRLNNHMGSCIGNSGRNASRAAAQKLSNGGSQGDGTPPSSQKGTPMPGPVSPRKRDGDELDEDADEIEAPNPKKKKIKQTPVPTPLQKKVVLKSSAVNKPGSFKKDKVKTASLLSVEQKVGDVDEPKKSAVVAPTKKGGAKVLSPLKLKQAVKPVPTPARRIGGGEDASSESSGTLSSPPQ